MFKLKFAIVLLVLSMMSSVFVSVGFAQDSFEPASCLVPVGDLIEGEEITCGYVTVPEFHDQDTGNSIRLPVAVVHSTSDSPADDPLIMAMGGPGATGLDNLLPLVLSAHGQTILAQRDVIVFEQRGVKYTEPHLTCPEVTAVEQEYIGKDTPADVEYEAYVACRDRFVADGVNFSAFTGVQSAADIPFIIDALGYEGQFNFYGVSYGTQLGQHLMRDHGDRLRSVIIDGVIEIAGYYQTRHSIYADRFFRYLFQSCSDDAACNEAYPDLESVFFEMVDDLTEEPVMLTISDEAGNEYEIPMDGESLIYGLTILAYSADALPMFPQWIYDISNGDYTLPYLLAQGLIFSEESQAPGMRDAIICSEEGLLIPNDVVDESALYPPVAAALGRDGGLAERCDVWDVDILGEYVNEPVVSDIPTLLISGEYDPVTPRSRADAVSENLSNHFSYTVPGGSHGSFLNVACVDSISAQFLDNPTQEPDASCLDDLEFAFAVPAPDSLATEFELVPVTLDALGVSTVVPDSWEAIDEGIYMSGETTLVFMALPGDDAATVVTELASSQEMPEPLALDNIEINALTWSVFAVLQEEQITLVAAAPFNGNIYIALLSGPETNVDVLGETLLLPAVEAFAIES